MGRSFDHLSLQDRARHYRAFAEGALRRSSKTVSESAHAELMALAACWHSLAMELERFHGHARESENKAAPAKPQTQARKG